jgi:hypothetical protein
MQAFADGMKRTGWITLCLTILLQAVAKKVLKMSWPLLTALQIILLTRNFNMYDLPQPAQLTLDTIGSIIGMEALSKKNVEDSFPESSTYLEKAAGILDFSDPLVLGIGLFFFFAALIAGISVLC